MRFIEFQQQFKNFVVISMKDIALVEPDFNRKNLFHWQKKGYIQMIKKGYYIFSDLPIFEKSQFSIANRIYAPSYISFESALSYYSIIPEAVFSITSASSKKTKILDTVIGKFSYISLKPELMFGYSAQRWNEDNINAVKYNHEEYPYLIADIEKTLLDYFYINNHLNEDKDFEGLRFNIEKFQFERKLDIEKMKSYVKVFNNKTLDKRINRFLNYIQNAVN